MPSAATSSFQTEAVTLALPGHPPTGCVFIIHRMNPALEAGWRHETGARGQGLGYSGRLPGAAGRSSHPNPCSLIPCCLAPPSPEFIGSAQKQCDEFARTRGRRLPFAFTYHPDHLRRQFVERTVSPLWSGQRPDQTLPKTFPLAGERVGPPSVSRLPPRTLPILPCLGVRCAHGRTNSPPYRHTRPFLRLESASAHKQPLAAPPSPAPTGEGGAGVGEGKSRAIPPVLSATNSFGTANASATPLSGSTSKRFFPFEQYYALRSYSHSPEPFRKINEIRVTLLSCAEKGIPAFGGSAYERGAGSRLLHARTFNALLAHQACLAWRKSLIALPRLNVVLPRLRGSQERKSRSL